jgi:hypothetical protein
MKETHWFMGVQQINDPPNLHSALMLFTSSDQAASLHGASKQVQ